MQIKKGTLIDVDHRRKGKFRAVATEDFDSEKAEFYPLAVAEGNGHVSGHTTDWEEGERIPCRNSICTISIVEQ